MKVIIRKKTRDETRCYDKDLGFQLVLLPDRKEEKYMRALFNQEISLRMSVVNHKMICPLAVHKKKCPTCGKNLETTIK